MATVEIGAIGASDSPSRRAYFLREVTLSKCKTGGMKQVKVFFFFVCLPQDLAFALLMTDVTLRYYI